MTEGSRFPTHLVWVYSLRLSQRSGLGCRENGGALSDRPSLGIEISNGEDCSDDHLYSWRESALAVARRGVGEAVPPATPAGMWSARRVISLPGRLRRICFDRNEFGSGGRIRPASGGPNG